MASFGDNSESSASVVMKEIRDLCHHFETLADIEDASVAAVIVQKVRQLRKLTSLPVDIDKQLPEITRTIKLASMALTSQDASGRAEEPLPMTEPQTSSELYFREITDEVCQGHPRASSACPFGTIRNAWEMTAEEEKEIYSVAHHSERDQKDKTSYDSGSPSLTSSNSGSSSVTSYYSCLDASDGDLKPSNDDRLNRALVEVDKIKSKVMTILSQYLVENGVVHLYLEATEAGMSPNKLASLKMPKEDHDGFLLFSLEQRKVLGLDEQMHILHVKTNATIKGLHLHTDAKISAKWKDLSPEEKMLWHDRSDAIRQENISVQEACIPDPLKASKDVYVCPQRRNVVLL